MASDTTLSPNIANHLIDTFGDEYLTLPVHAKLALGADVAEMLENAAHSQEGCYAPDRMRDYRYDIGAGNLARYALTLLAK